MPYEFQLKRRVEFCDTDMAGIMHFSNFFRFMEATETAFMRDLGFSVVLSRYGLEVCLPRVHAECDYAAPLRFEDEVLVHLLVEKKGTRTLTYQFRFRKLAAPARPEVARGRIVLVCAERQSDGTLKAVPLPRMLAVKIQEAPKELIRQKFLAPLENSVRSAGAGETKPESRHKRAAGTSKLQS
jgi:YbgC/YbaW family acyl-CoA thioester hydrolase